MTKSIICAMAACAVLLGGCREKSSTNTNAAKQPQAAQAPAIPADAKWRIEHRVFHRVNGSPHSGDVIRGYYASWVEAQGAFLRFIEAGSGKVRFISGGQVTVWEL